VLWVWIAVVVLALLVLGVLAFTVLGALQRLVRELRATDAVLAPVRAEVQQTAQRAAAPRGGDRPATSA
jgi:hypothetical protein